jgi:hypothetical protein
MRKMLMRILIRYSISAQESERASEMRNEIATAMWNDFH